MTATVSQTALSVSVVITSYNHARFLGDAIDSALRQTRPCAEIVVVDDGSEDDGATRRVAERYPDVRYVWQPNAGLSAARNRGIEESSGDCLIFLDADDRLTPAAIEVCSDTLEAAPDLVAVYGDFERIDGEGRRIPSPHRFRQPRDLYAALLTTNVITMHATVAYRRDVFRMLGGFDPSLRACEDYEMYLRVARQFPVGAHGRVVAQYRQHGSNMSAQFGLMLNSALEVLERESEFCRDKPEYRAAQDTGRRFWRSCFGNLLTRKVACEAGRFQWSSAMLNDSTTIMRNYAAGAPRSLAQVAGSGAKKALRRFAPAWLVERARKAAPNGVPRGWVRFGSLRRTAPVSRCFGFDRGTPIDRYYIEQFLESGRSRITGRVLEFGDDSYTRRFGGDAVTKRDVLNLAESPHATIVGDLTTIDLGENVYDCIICTQTLHCIYDVQAALRTLHRSLKPGGTVLITFPGISQICRDPEGKWSDYWRFTMDSARRTVAAIFPETWIRAESYGNVFAAMAFLQGLAVAEVRPKDLEPFDADYPLILGIEARKQK